MFQKMKNNPIKTLLVLAVAGAAGYYAYGSSSDGKGSNASGKSRPSAAQRGGGSRYGGGARGGRPSGGGSLAQARYAAVAKGKIDIDGGIINVAARRGGTFRDVFVAEGDYVTKGQVLAVQEDNEEQIALKSAAARVAAAEASVARIRLQMVIAKRELERLKPLLKKDNVSKIGYDRASDDVKLLSVDMKSQQAALAQQKANLESVKFLLEQRTVRAPMDGRIIEVQAQPGVGASSLQVSTAFVLMPNAQKIVRADVDEAFVSAVKVGQDVIISPDARPSETYKGKVLRVGQVFGRRITQETSRGGTMSDYAIEVVLSVADNDMKIGQRVLARFIPEKKKK